MAIDPASVLRPILTVDRTFKDGRFKIYRKFHCPYKTCVDCFYTNRQYFAHCDSCHICNKCFLVLESLNGHVCNLNQTGQGAEANSKLVVKSGKFAVGKNIYRNTLLTFIHNFKKVFASFSDAFEYLYEDIELIIKQCIEQKKAIKVSFTIGTTLIDMKSEKVREFRFFSPFQRHFNSNFIMSSVMASADYLISSLNVFNQEESGMRLNSINFMEIRIASYNPIRPKGFIPLPNQLSSKYFINVKSTDSRCFAYSVLAAIKHDSLRLTDHPSLIYEEASKSQKQKFKRLYENQSTYISMLAEVIISGEINFKGFLDECKAEELSEFEKLNPEISITVFTNEGKNLIPHRVTEKLKPHHIDLLLLKRPKITKSSPLPSVDDTVEFDYHFCWIKDLPAVVGKRHHNRSLLCNYCFKAIGSDDALRNHLEICNFINAQRITFPTEDTYEFKKLHMYENIPFKIFFSFQYYMEPNQSDCSTLNSAMNIKSNLIVFSYTVVVVGPMNGRHDEFIKQYHYDKEKPMDHFFSLIFRLSNKIESIVKSTNVPIKLTSLENLHHQLAIHCSLCHGEFSIDLTKHKDHDHFTGQFRRTICQPCNQGIRVASKPIVIGHGINNLELHTILKHLKPDLVKRAKIICKSHEEILSLSLDGIRFLDSQLFLNAELESLVHRQWAGRGVDDFSERFPIFYSAMKPSIFLPYLFRKLWFPTKYFDSPAKANQKNLPSDVEEYIDLITGNVGSAEDVEMTRYIFNKFNCKTIAEFNCLASVSKLYLLADVVVSFVNYAMEHFSLSPLRSISLSSYAYDACMSSLESGFQYIKDYEKIKFIMDSVVAGPAVTSTRFIRSNCERLKGTWNGISNDRAHCLSIDQNSMYPYCLMGNLPFSDYEWMTQKELDSLDFKTLTEDDETGYLISCSIKYPRRLHNRDKDLPFCVSKRRVMKAELSEQQQEVWDLLKDSMSDPFSNEKIIMDLHDKSAYTAYGTTLKYYESMGIIIESRIKGLKFKQRPFLRAFFENVLHMRNLAQSQRDEVFQLFLKSLLCRIFGIMLSNTSKYTEAIVCLNRTDALNYLSRHNFLNYTIINPDTEVVLFHMRRNTLHYRYPLLCSAVALNKAKVELYKQWVNIRELFPGAKHCFTDTDSIAALIPDPDNNYFQKLKMLPKMDFSTIHPMHCLYNTNHQNTPGFWKVVHMDVIEIVAPRPKAYSMLIACEKCQQWTESSCLCLMKKRASGIPRPELLKLTHEFFKESVFNNNISQIESTRLRSLNHELVMVQSTTTGFQSLNIGRFLMKDNIHSLPFGHFTLQSMPDLVPI